jgi:hypothetical protein
VAERLEQYLKVGDDMEDDRWRADQSPQGSPEQKEARLEARKGSDFIDLNVIGSLFLKHMQILK